MNRDRPINIGNQDTSPAVPSPRYDINTAREEIKGLKYANCLRIMLFRLFSDRRHIIQELQKSNAAVSNQNKLLESENRMLLSETDQLREVGF